MSGDNLPKPGTFIPLGDGRASGMPAPGTFIPFDRKPPPEAAPPEDPGFLSNSPDDSWLSSAAKGTGTVLGKAVAAVPGLPGDIAGLLDYATTGVQSYIQDKPHAELMKQRAEDIAKKKAEGQWQFPTSEELYRKGANAVGAGEYKATSVPGKYMMIGGEGAASMLMPFGVAGKGVKAAREALTAGKGAGAATRAGIGATLPGVGVGAGVTAGAHAVGEMTESPGAALAFGLGAPLAGGVVKGGYNALRNPVRGARERFIDSISGVVDPANPNAPGDKRPVIASILAGGEDVAQTGAPRTTAQAYPDNGLSSEQIRLLQTSQATDAAKMRMMNVQERQRRANQGQLETLAPDTAEPLALPRAAQVAQQQLDDDVRRLTAALDTERDPVRAGELQQQIAKAESRALDGRVSALYNSVDRDGVAQVPMDNTKQLAEQLLDSHKPLYGEMDKGLKGWLERIAGRGKDADGNPNPGLGERLSYQDAVELDKAIENMRREAAVSGSGTARQYGQLKSAIMDDLPNVQLPPTAASAGQTPAETLRAAKDLYIESKRRFENAYVEGGLKTTKPYGDFIMQPEKVAKQVFQPGDGGGRAVTAWLAAAGPQGVQQAQDIALARLHEMRRGPGGVIQPISQDMLDRWRNQYRSALGAIDTAAPGFSTQFDNAAAAQSRLNAFTESRAAQFLGVQDRDQMYGMVGRILDRPDGAAQLREVLSQFPPTERQVIMEGVQRAGSQYIVRQFISPKSGDIQGAQFAKYVTRHEGALRELFGPNYQRLENIANELARHENVQKAGMTHGSSTGFNTRDELKQKASQDVSVPEAVMSTGIMQPVLGTVPAAAVTGAMGLRNLWHRLEKGRQSTINDIITDAVFDPAAARRLLQGRYKLAGTPGPAIAPRAAIRGAQEGMSEIEERENLRRREGRKAGGRIGGVDHGAIAMSLIRAAEKAKKGHNTTTQPLLEQPDEAITKALAIADEALK
jgi:hypothetical protein